MLLSLLGFVMILLIVFVDQLDFVEPLENLKFLSDSNVNNLPLVGKSLPPSNSFVAQLLQV